MNKYLIKIAVALALLLSSNTVNAQIDSLCQVRMVEEIFKDSLFLNFNSLGMSYADTVNISIIVNQNNYEYFYLMKAKTMVYCVEQHNRSQGYKQRFYNKTHLIPDRHYMVINLKKCKGDIHLNYYQLKSNSTGKYVFNLVNRDCSTIIVRNRSLGQY